jgi:hypothetical protein
MSGLNAQRNLHVDAPLRVARDWRVVSNDGEHDVVALATTDGDQPHRFNAPVAATAGVRAPSVSTTGTSVMPLDNAISFPHAGVTVKNRNVQLPGLRHAGLRVGNDSGSLAFEWGGNGERARSSFTVGSDGTARVHAVNLDVDTLRADHADGQFRFGKSFKARDVAAGAMSATTLVTPEVSTPLLAGRDGGVRMGSDLTVPDGGLSSGHLKLMGNLCLSKPTEASQPTCLSESDGPTIVRYTGEKDRQQILADAVASSKASFTRAMADHGLAARVQRHTDTVEASSAALVKSTADFNAAAAGHKLSTTASLVVPNGVTVSFGDPAGVRSSLSDSGSGVDVLLPDALEVVQGSDGGEGDTQLLRIVNDPEDRQQAEVHVTGVSATELCTASGEECYDIT